ncbi:glycosyltransferase family 2 protein [Algirhabdus cladophorae]|uniref:glycosyltransferase family 2 protein n=1 Tax=Algirhabdus cladophorae TaxID=3377108 RepID=UPI003B84A4F2
MNAATRLFAHPPAARARVAEPVPQDTGLLDALLQQNVLCASDWMKARVAGLTLEHDQAQYLLTHRMVKEADLMHALHLRYGIDEVNLASTPPDTRLIDAFGLQKCIKHGVLPWRQLGKTVVVATAHPNQFERLRNSLPAPFDTALLALASERQIQTSLLANREKKLAEMAQTRVAPEDSCRDWSATRLKAQAALLFAMICTAFWVAPTLSFAGLCLWASMFLITNTWLKAHAAGLVWWQGPVAPPLKTTHMFRKPVVSIMVPLFKEREIASTLITRLERLRYPKALLDICLVIEADDDTTQATLASTTLPVWMRIIKVPQGALKTKPRALNYALDFCRGQIIGIYDAEDAPDPDQINTVVQQFHNSPPQVACLQGILDFYNRHSNWLSRCFSVEYATWFRVVLPGLSRLGFVIPLGGTTLFFRRAALEDLGGWDAHNVTEDADLGVRLARHGYETHLVASVTQEEANCRTWPWIKQRSRWLKGYAITYGVHMRRPLKLWRDLGAWRFFGFQVLFLGALSQFVLAPILWSFWLVPLGLPHPLDSVLPTWGFWVVGGFFALSELVNILVGMFAVSERSHRDLMKWVPSLHFYYPLGALASYKGLWEIITKPFYWDKTAHGIFAETLVKSPTQPPEPRPRQT